MTVQTKTLEIIEQTQTMTAEELLRMPDDGFRYELIRGTLRKMAPAGCEPGKISINLSTPLDMHVLKLFSPTTPPLLLSERLASGCRPGGEW